MKEVFGYTAQGDAVERVRISGGGLTAYIMSWGAVLQDLRLAGHEPPLVLGFPRFEDYPAHSPYFGAIVGRVANRIAGGRFSIGGREYETDRNEGGRHTLHGGSDGTGSRLWTFGEITESRATLTLHDPAGMMGFPGNVDIGCTYELTEQSTMRITLEAQTDAATPLSLAHHSYFNLDGSADCGEHRLQIEADRYLPVDGDLIPTGEVAAVQGTALDFLQQRQLRESRVQGGLDHNFCLADSRRKLSIVARLCAGGVTMYVATTEPGLQCYDGRLINTPVPGLTGERYGPFSGVALEPQCWPDAVHHPQFPDIVLRPDDRWRQISEFRFSNADAGF